MFVLAVLALLLLGALLGGAGLKRLGRLTGRVADRWRPGAGMGAILLAIAGLAVLVRGAWVVGIPLLIFAIALTLAVRKRPARVPSTTASAMSEAEARSLLGLEAGATRADIQAAYVRLIQRVHPDHGGASGLASQLNLARARLLD